MVDRLLVVLSDVEMGAGGPVDDCPHSEAIADLLLSYSAKYTGLPVDFVFNGDTFDFLKTSVDGEYPRHICDTVALRKLSRIRAAHSCFFEKVASLLRRRDRTVSFVVGNHDFELFFPAVREELTRSFGGGSIRFPGMTLDVGDVHIEHGSQGDPMFRIDPERRFLEHEGRTILNLPWAAVGIIDAVLPYHSELHLLDRVRPKQVLFERVPEARELLTALARRYWLGAFWRDLLLERDPLKQLSWEIVKEVAHRMAASEADVSLGDYYVEALAKDEGSSVFVVAHEHVGRQVRLSDAKTLLATGCLRNEYVFDEGSDLLRHSERSIAEIRMRDGRAVDARLTAVSLPVAGPPELSELRPVVARCLDSIRGDVAPTLAVALDWWRRRGRRREVSFRS